MSDKYLELTEQINNLGEYLYDDHGDTINQLGKERTNELELEYKALIEKRNTLDNHE